MLYLKRIYTFNKNEEEKVISFFDNLKDKLGLSKRVNKKIIANYVNAFVILRQMGVHINDVIKRLDPERLGSFYKEDLNAWYNLDNSAIVYPLAMGHGSMGMFRLSYYMNEDIIPELLQVALNNVIRRFPVFATTLRRGFFWHYLDSNKSYYQVKYDNSIPCAILNLSFAKSNAFKVYYYDNRISVDFFHILTDANGGIVFLNTLVAEYLRILGKNIETSKTILDINEMPKKEEISDDFYKMPNIEGDSSFADKFPAQIKGRRSRTRKRVLHFDMDSNKLLELARSKNITITTLVLGYIFKALKNTNERKKKDFTIQVPVNMHKYYESNTLRNLALFAMIKENENNITDDNEFLLKLQEQLIEKTSKTEMTKMATMTKKLVKKLNFVPLVVKFYILKIIYPFMSEKTITTCFSNVGKISLPSPISDSIIKGDFVLSVQNINRAVCSLITVNDITTLSLSMITKDKSFEEELYNLLKEAGLDMDISGGDNFGL